MRVRVRRGVGVLSLFTTTVHTGALGPLVARSPAPWYSKYGETTAAWSLTALEDQQLAGLIMWMPAALVYTAGALGSIQRWRWSCCTPAVLTASKKAATCSAAILNAVARP